MEDRVNITIKDETTFNRIKTIAQISSRAERRKEIHRRRQLMGRLKQKVNAWNTKIAMQRQGREVA